MAEKTLAMKVLEGQKVAYEVFSYPATERDAAVIATHFGVPPEQVFKTLVVERAPAKPLLVLVPAHCQLNLKKLAQVTGDKKLKMATHAQAEALTKLQVGGISPLALLNKGFVVLIDQSAQAQDKIFVSAGQKGLNLRVATADLGRITHARFVDVAEEL
ncbi:MAG: aminoacyl-tRNA deacylase [Chloroflexi bacterium]|nr:aminoacyl-tRNA deacylase [Chloroflexota bacterium]